VRNLAVPGIGQQEFLSGTESAVGASPIQLSTPFGAPRSLAPAGAPVPTLPNAPIRPTPLPFPSSTPQAPPAINAPGAFNSPTAPAAAPAANPPPAFSPPSLVPSSPGKP
jgi:hypothetical protein